MTVRTTTRLILGMSDYVIIILTIAVSVLIGIYHGLRSRKKGFDVADYLIGGRKLSLFPVIMSTSASVVAGASFFTFPAEIYTNGTLILWWSVSNVMSAIISANLFMPVFYRLGVTSVYEYLERRFDSKIRTFACVLAVTKAVLITALDIYSSALVTSQITGHNLWTSSLVFSVACIIYTTLGGIRSVVWTDTLQMIIMFVATFLVIAVGTYDVGGVAEVWHRADETGRIEFFNFKFDPRIRHTTWNVLFVGIFYFFPMTVDQGVLQRCLSLPSESKAKLLLSVYPIVVSIFTFSCKCFGLVMIAAYHDCDPIASGKVQKSDELMLYFVSHMKTVIPTLPGFLTAGILSASLSSISTALNSIAAITLEDIVRPIFKKFRKSQVTNVQEAIALKSSVVVFGALCIFLSTLMPYFPNYLQALMVMNSTTLPVVFGLFAYGMLNPRANTAGAFIGGLVSFLFLIWLAIGAQLAVARGDIVHPPKKSYVYGCNETFEHQNITFLLNNRTMDASDPESFISTKNVFILFQISYIYLFLIGPVLIMVVGSIVSCMTRTNDESANEHLLSPQIRKFVRPKRLVDFDPPKEGEGKELDVNHVFSNLIKPSSYPDTAPLNTHFFYESNYGNRVHGYRTGH